MAYFSGVAFVLLLNSFNLLLVEGIILRLETRQLGAHIIVTVESGEENLGRLPSEHRPGCLAMETTSRIEGLIRLIIKNSTARNAYKIDTPDVCSVLNYSVITDSLEFKFDQTMSVHQSVSVSISSKCEDDETLYYNDSRQENGALELSWTAPSTNLSGWEPRGSLSSEYETTVLFHCKDENPTSAAAIKISDSTLQTRTLPASTTENKPATNIKPTEETVVNRLSTTISASTNHSSAVTQGRQLTLDPNIVLILSIVIPASVVILVLIITISVLLYKRGGRHTTPDLAKSRKTKYTSAEGAGNTINGHKVDGDALYDAIAMDIYSIESAKKVNKQFPDQAAISRAATTSKITPNTEALYTQVKKPTTNLTSKSQAYSNVSPGMQELPGKRVINTDIEMVDNELYGTADESTYYNS